MFHPVMGLGWNQVKSTLSSLTVFCAPNTGPPWPNRPFLLLAPDSCCRLGTISPPTLNCLSAHLTADWSDAACCQSLRQRVQCQITHLFFLSPLPWADSVLYVCLTAALRVLCIFAENASSCAKWGPRMFCVK